MNKRAFGYGAGGLLVAAGVAVAGTFAYRHFVQGGVAPAATAAANPPRVIRMGAEDAPTVPPGAVKIAPIAMKKPPVPASQPAQAKAAPAKTADAQAAQPKVAQPKVAQPKPSLTIQPKPATTQPKAPQTRPTTQPRTAPAKSAQSAQAKKSRVISLQGSEKPTAATNAALTPADKASLSVVHQLRSLRNAIQVWRYRHGGQAPDFITHAAWEQFVRPDKQGQVLSQTPVNPLNGLSDVMAIKGEARAGEAVGGKFGYVYSSATGRLWATDAGGRVLDEAAIDTLSLEVRAVRGLSPREAEQYLLVGLDSMRNQVALYQMQHGDRQPDFRTYPAFEQFLKPTFADGRIVDGEAPGPQPTKGPASYGPYLLSTPVNPLNGKYKVAVVAGEVKPGQKVTVADAGFVFSTGRNELYATDAAGCVFDDAKAREAYTPRGASAAAPLQK